MLSWSSSSQKLEACDFATNQLHNSPLHKPVFLNFKTYFTKNIQEEEGS